MPRWLIWPLFALLMGFALGGSFVWGILYSPPEQYAVDNYHPNEHPPEKENKNGFWEKAREDPVAYFTLWLVAFTGILAVSTIGLWIVTWQSGKRQSKDMTESIDVAERALIAGERAWVKVDVSVNGDLTVDDGGINLPVDFTVRNCGNSPCTDVRVFSDLRFKQPGKPEALEAYRQFSANVRARAEKPEIRNFRSYTLFPDERRTIRVQQYISRERIDEAITAWEAALADVGGAAERSRYFDLFMIGCVAYRVPFDNVQHQTGFSVEVKRRLPVTMMGGGWGMFDLEQTSVGAIDIAVTASVWGSPNID